MEERYGIILIDRKEVIIRIYQINAQEWKLVHYLNNSLKNKNHSDTSPLNSISMIFADVFSAEYARHIAEWYICSRNTHLLIAEEVHRLTGIAVENLTAEREQELICKGMFTELW